METPYIFKQSLHLILLGGGSGRKQIFGKDGVIASIRVDDRWTQVQDQAV